MSEVYCKTCGKVCGSSSAYCSPACYVPLAESMTPKQRLIEAIQEERKSLCYIIPTNDYEESYNDGRVFQLNRLLKLVEEILP